MTQQCKCEDGICTIPEHIDSETVAVTEQGMFGDLGEHFEIDNPTAKIVK